MDFDKTSFSVDWFTPGDKYGPKRLSFPKSACISIDDLVSDSPLTFCFTPVDEAIPRSHTHSIVDTPYERACGWTNSAPPSPLVPSPREPYHMYDQDPKNTNVGNPTDWRALASPGILSIIDDCAACGVEVDVSCLDTLDEQLLLSPVECFTELCWSAAVHDDVTSPIVRRNSRSRARSFKGERERCLPPAVRDYPGSFERTRPLAAKISLPLDMNPHLSSSPSSDSHDTSLTYPEKPAAYIMYADPQGRPPATPAHDMSMPWRMKKRELMLAPSVDSFARSHAHTPPMPRLKTSKSSHALRVVSDACVTFARAGKRSPLAAP